eukprot:CAMPEP_0174288934 /NCGR_PEP_ID=MMETSP0809-20121228/22887_1 /TAXON_ID=73025 ORGANISM="Eutreptiella gymnastica-like, Strain CCMP1594" /NCGR_SAMPLE_ID=MMETSP0809 /ASSEMBLY_ACC=CAM_ASM_000658 /LENGTH=50 /DNA_ID=CAMNT_0015386527 /DNA_START=217 /DNA_END=366 /DNA_ORIENTATION=+
MGHGARMPTLGVLPMNEVTTTRRNTSNCAGACSPVGQMLVTAMPGIATLA